MTLIERLEEAFDKRVGGTAMLPASDVLSASIEIQRIQTELIEAQRQLANEKAAEQIRRCDCTPARSTLLEVLK